MTPRYRQARAPEVLKDDEGSVTMGWVGDGAFHARFVGALSARLGTNYVLRLREILSAVPAMGYFSDASELTRYDLVARSAIARLVLENRRKFSAIVMLTWSGGITPAMRAFAESVGEPITVLSDASEFDKLLVSAAPLAKQRLDPRTWPTAPAPNAVRR